VDILLRIIADAPGERVALAVCVAMIFFMAYALAALWKRDRAQERELQEIHKLQRELLHTLILDRTGGRNDSHDKAVVDKPEAGLQDDPDAKAPHPEPGAFNSQQ